MERGRDTVKEGKEGDVYGEGYEDRDRDGDGDDGIGMGMGE